MLAFLKGPSREAPGLTQRVGGSLGLFCGVAAPHWSDDQRIAWQLPPVAAFPPRSQRAGSALFRRCDPAQLPGGIVVLFHGWLDNIRQIAAELGCPPHDPALVYGQAVRAWGDGADNHLLGNYCAIYDDPAAGAVRLARSPFNAPPLYYFLPEGGVGAASVPRALEAMGLARQLNRRRLADSLFFNLSDEESYLCGSFKVPYGSIVHAGPAACRTLRFYDPLAIKPLPKVSAQDYVREADRLLTEAAGIYLASGRNPGVLLSGGLDSANLAARLLRHLPQGQPLHSFTYVPLAGHGQAELPGCLVDEGPAVQAFAAQHPQIVPHLVDNQGIEFDHRLEEMFLAMGTGSVNLATLFRYHGIYQAAAEAGCDMLLSADYGNFTFSASGSWAFAEYLRQGRLIQLWRALRGDVLHPRSLPWRFAARAIAPMLPDGLWRIAMRLRGGAGQLPGNAAISGLSAAAMESFTVKQRAIAAGTWYERSRYGWREDLIRDNFARGDVEGADLAQGWEQLYEVSMRDPATYRPLVEFCLGLPTDMFMRDGQDRWLARELGRGLLPEAQRTMPGHGQHNADWHKRLTPRRADLARAITELDADPDLAGLIDTAALQADLDHWPAAQSLAAEVYFPHAFRLPRVVAMARYVRFMTGRNQS